MSNAPNLREIFNPPDEIIQAGLNGELVLFIGAGASMLLEPPLPSWSGLAAKALEDLRTKEHLNYSEIAQLRTLDPKKQLSIAYLIADDKQYRTRSIGLVLVDNAEKGR